MKPDPDLALLRAGVVGGLEDEDGVPGLDGVAGSSPVASLQTLPMTVNIEIGKFWGYVCLFIILSVIIPFTC